MQTQQCHGSWGEFVGSSEPEEVGRDLAFVAAEHLVVGSLLVASMEVVASYFLVRVVPSKADCFADAVGAC